MNGIGNGIYIVRRVIVTTAHAAASGGVFVRIGIAGPNHAHKHGVLIRKPIEVFEMPVVQTTTAAVAMQIDQQCSAGFVMFVELTHLAFVGSINFFVSHSMYDQAL